MRLWIISLFNEQLPELVKQIQTAVNFFDENIMMEGTNFSIDYAPLTKNDVKFFVKKKS